MRISTLAGTTWGLFAAIVTLVSAISIAAAPVDILTLDSTRSPNDFSNSAGFAGARNDLLDPSNFGPSGVVHQTIQSITSVPTITPASLNGIEIVILSDLAVLPTPAETAALSSFVNAGGRLFVADNFASVILQPILGVTPGLTSSSGSSTVSNGASPLVNGPFGALPVGTTFTNGFDGSFATGGLTAAGTEAVTNDAGILAASFEVAGGGLVAAFSDEEMFGSPGFIGGDAFYGGSSQTAFLNSIAYLIPVPEPMTLLPALVCTAVVIARSSRRHAPRSRVD